MVTTILGVGGRAFKFPLSYLPTDKEVTKKAISSYMLINEGTGDLIKRPLWIQWLIGCRTLLGLSRNHFQFIWMAFGGLQRHFVLHWTPPPALPWLRCDSVRADSTYLPCSRWGQGTGLQQSQMLLPEKSHWEGQNLLKEEALYRSLCNWEKTISALWQCRSCWIFSCHYHVADTVQAHW